MCVTCLLCPCCTTATGLKPNCSQINNNNNNKNHIKTLKTESESESLCDWRFTGNHFVLAPSPIDTHDQNFFTTLSKNSFRTSQERNHASATETIRLTLFRETVALYCRNNTKHTNSVGKMPCFGMLRNVVRIVTIGLSRVNINATSNRVSYYLHYSLLEV
jgi:hypothetical protein